MRNLLCCFLVTSISLFAAESPKAETPKSLDLSVSETKVQFLAIGKPSMLKINGKAKSEDGAKMEGVLQLRGDSLAGTAKFPLDSLTTGISLRDRHMKEKYLETGKYPKAEFTLTELKLPAPLVAGDGEAKGIPFKGTLSVHGVPQPVTGTVDIEREGAKAEMDFKFNTTIPSHKIELPSFMGVTVAEDVEITVEVEGPLS